MNLASLMLDGLRSIDRRLIEHLAEGKYLTLTEINLVLGEWQRSNAPLHDHFTRLGLLSASVLRDVRAQLLQLPSIDLAVVRPDPSVVTLLSASLARHHQMLPVTSLGEGHILLAVYEPSNLVAIDQITAHLRGKGITQISLGLASATDLYREIDRFFGARIDLAQLLAVKGKEPPIDKVLEAVLQQAYDLEASDIHFEPDEFFLRIRLRIDGVLRQTHLISATVWASLAVRIKVIAGMNIAENRAAQDGRFAIKLGMRSIDFRVACLPTAHGENIVLRLLDKSKNIVPLHLMTMSEEARRAIDRAIAKPEGMILVTGPTGSGKTTTLYSILSQISTEGINVMTLEDPIEYPLPLIRQTQINEKIGFASGVRALMRQDPDVILVGEIRDQETAEMAFRAAMTGHQVFATLHTNSALASVQRLRDMGIGSHILAGNLVAVVGQRLARRLCLDCKKRVPINAADKARLGIAGVSDTFDMSDTSKVSDMSDISNVPQENHASHTHIYQAVGCQHCAQTGYRGRLVLMEVLLFDEEMDALVASQAHSLEISRYAKSKGFISLREDAVRRVLLGDSTIDEVARVVSLTTH